jgi:hypothetical protein
MRADGGVACELSITLVHGTWPRNVWRDVFLTPFYGKWPSSCVPKSLWFADGSEFRNRLAAALSKLGFSARISPFLWSSANSVRERNQASRELAEHIRAKQSDYPSSTQVVIAHSHGGNVALRALDQLGLTRDEIFLATIATPFVEILRTRLSPAETERIDIMFSATTSILLPAYVIDIKYAFFPTLDSYFLTFIAVLASTLLFLLLYGLRARNTRKVDELVGLTSLSPSVRKHPLLVLRAVDDEASLTLAASAIGNRLSRLLEWLSYKIWSLLRFLTLSLIAFILVLIAISFFWSLDDFSAPAFVTRFFQPVFAFSFEWGPTLGRWTILAFFAFLFSPGAFNSAYGRELLPVFQGCEISSQSAPDSIGLRHSLYDDPQCAERIAGWLQFELASRGT